MLGVKTAHAQRETVQYLAPMNFGNSAAAIEGGSVAGRVNACPRDEAWSALSKIYGSIAISRIIEGPKFRPIGGASLTG